MAKQSARPKAKESLISSRPGGDGHQVHNPGGAQSDLTDADFCGRSADIGG
jgi:hypothetical protein